MLERGEQRRRVAAQADDPHSTLLQRELGDIGGVGKRLRQRLEHGHHGRAAILQRPGAPRGVERCGGRAPAPRLPLQGGRTPRYIVGLGADRRCRKERPGGDGRADGKESDQRRYDQPEWPSRCNFGSTAAPRPQRDGGGGRLGLRTRDDSVGRETRRCQLFPGGVNGGARRHQDPHVEARSIVGARANGEAVGHLARGPRGEPIELVLDDPAGELARLRRDIDPPLHNLGGGKLEGDELSTRLANEFG